MVQEQSASRVTANKIFEELPGKAFLQKRPTRAPAQKLLLCSWSSPGSLRTAALNLQLIGNDGKQCSAECGPAEQSPPKARMRRSADLGRSKNFYTPDASVATTNP